ncbi:uL30 family ribosomal protein [Candidatus Tremblaya phenacola]|uniref:50S ribosomal protein L30 n=1 Tax=Candidatus Tremblayella phenacoccinincola TaxID=1010676 RepID=A0A2G0V6V9_9PROT|nr:uL30 family ribosomal protein [Candidatus Tremblaya phenacola]PHN16199.1 50S ribosomal protein L30 [Candidatus Tremblaya phenacola]
MTTYKKILVQLVRSLISVSSKHRAYIRTLGLRKLWSFRIASNNKHTVDLIKKVPYLVKVLNIKHPEGNETK